MRQTCSVYILIEKFQFCRYVLSRVPHYSLTITFPTLYTQKSLISLLNANICNNKLYRILFFIQNCWLRLQK